MSDKDEGKVGDSPAEKPKEDRTADPGDRRVKNGDGTVAGSGDQRPDDLDGDTEEALDDVQEVVDEETSQGFRGTEVDSTPNENYTVQGVGADPYGVPEAAEFKTEAIEEATNPEVRARH